jgi:Protein of unknown function (DUF3040)
MSLPTRQQHVLDQIEASLQSGDPRLKSMFATFTRLTSREAMPARESICRRLTTRTMVVSVMVVAMLGLVLAAALVSGPGCVRTHANNGTARTATVVSCQAIPKAAPGGG